MADVSKAVGEDYRGLAIPDPRWSSSTFVRADSSINEAGAQPGVVVAGQPTGMVLESSGTMPDIAGLVPSLVLTTNRGGMPGLADARFTFTPNYSIPAGYQTTVGWDSPSAISRYAKFVNEPAGNAYMGGCITLQSNTVLVAVGWVNGATTTIRAHRKLFDGASYASAASVVWDDFATVVDIASSSTATPGEAIVAGSACFVQFPEGRIHCYWIVKNTAVTTESFYNVRMAVSDDDGVTWAIAGKSCLMSIIRGDGVTGATIDGYEVTRCRAAYSAGQVLMLIEGYSHDTANYDCVSTHWQYGSYDLGHSFAMVDISNTATSHLDGGYMVGALPAAGVYTEGGAYFDVVAARDGAFVVSYVCAGRPGAGASFGPKVRTKRLGTAFENWTQVAAVDVIESGAGALVFAGMVNANLVSNAGTTIAIADCGMVVLGWEKDVDSAGARVGTCGVALSYDHAATWDAAHGRISDLNQTREDRWHPWWNAGDTFFHPTEFCSTFQCGRWLVFALFLISDGQEQEGGVTDRADGPVEIDLGGYTTATRPYRYPAQDDIAQMMWDVNWVAAQRLTDTTSWTAVGTGTETLTPLQFTAVTTAGGQTKSLERNAALAVTSGEHRVFALFECKVTAGTSRFEVRIGDGVNKYELAFEFSSTQFQVYDILAAAAVYGPAAPPVPGDWHQVFLSLDYSTKTASVWIRDGRVDREARPWKRLLNRAAFTTAASADASRIRVYQPASSMSYWREIHEGDGPYGYTAESPAGWAHDDIHGRVYSPYPVHVYSGGGVRVRAVDGPTWDNDTFTITQRHEYGIENVFPDVAPSPRKTWRSTDLTAQSIVCQLDFSGDPSPLLGRVLVVGAFGCNFDDITIQYRTTSGGGGWSALGSLSLRSGQTGLRWIRDGKMVRPDTAAAANHANDYFTFNTLEGSHVVIEDQGSNLVSRKIKANSEGVWANTAAAVRTRIYSEDILVTDLASGITGEIWSKDGILILRDCPDICELRFLIAAAPHANYIVEGYYEIGSLFVGHLAYFGKQYARGRAFTLAANSAVTTGRSGSRRSQVYGPARRSVEFGWSNENESDASRLVAATGGGEPSPDYILSASGSTEPAATPADTPYKMQGLVEHLRGAATPCIYLPKVPMASGESGDTTLVNRNTFLRGRITSDPRVETVLGSEWAAGGEVARISTVTFEEEV